MRRPVHPVLVLVLAAVVAAGCTSSDPEVAVPTVPETTTTVPTTTTSTTVAPTTTTGPPRTTTTTLVSIGPGDASIGGTVTGPAGPVDGATVRVERLVGRAVATVDVTTTGGTWQLGSILGGSYRVRAFKAPELAQSQTEAFFLAATERKTIDFRLNAAGGERITAAVSPSPPRVDQPATLTVRVGVGTVDAEGRPSLNPRPGVPLSLAPGAGITVESAPQVVTDASGSAAWRIRCTAEGASTLPLTVGTGITNVQIAACAAGAGPTTTRAS